MNAMEFMNDEYASWDVTYYLNGFFVQPRTFAEKVEMA